MKNINWEEVKEISQFPIPGGYAAKITRVEDREDKEYLWIEWDFADGQFKGYNKETYDKLGFWGFPIIRSYKESALSFFKAFKTSVENSNPGYTFKNDPQSLVGKYVGVVLGEEEYQAKDGSIKKRLYVAEIHSGEKIRNGDFKIPELKRLPGHETSSSVQNNNDFVETDDDDDLPF